VSVVANYHKGEAFPFQLLIFLFTHNYLNTLEKAESRDWIMSTLSALLNYIFIIITILQCNSVFYRAGNHLGKIQLLWMALLALIFLRSVAGIYLSKMDITKLLIYELFFSMVMLALLIAEYQMTSISKGVVVLYFLAPFMLIVVFYQASRLGNTDYLFIAYKNVVLALAVVSLLFWLLSMLKLPTNMNTPVLWGSYRQLPGYFGIHYIAQGQTVFLGLSMIRNTGLFVEAPMYSYVLSIALMVLLFVDKRVGSKKNLEVLILLFAIFTTTSTTGIIVALLAVMYDLLIVRNKASMLFKTIIVLAGVLIVGLIIRIVLLRKIQVEGVGSSSVRWNDIQSGFYAWRNHLWLGNGFGNYDVIEAYMSPNRLVMNGNSGFSSGLMEVLAYGGVLTAMFQIVPTFLALFRSKRLFGLAAISFLLFVFTIVNDVYIYIMLLSYFWVMVIFRSTNNGSECLE
ncbi:O-antigen ligase family protein, partial [Levilactobacillus parabrevis]